MKTSIICAFAVIALIQIADANPYKRLLRVRSIDDLRVCEPGDTKKEDCNDCFCAANGSGWACTRRGCYISVVKVADDPENSTAQAEGDNPSERVKRDLDATTICIPNEMIKVDCNWCTCTPDGQGLMCTEMACPPKDLVPITRKPNTTIA